jgi:SNF family Na+-dependent transporter
VWVLLFLATCRGVKATSWVVLVTVPLPLVLLVAMVIHAMQHEGSADGVRAYVVRLPPSV